MEQYMPWVISGCVAVGLAAWPVTFGWLVTCQTGRLCRVLKAMREA